MRSGPLHGNRSLCSCFVGIDCEDPWNVRCRREEPLVGTEWFITVGDAKAIQPSKLTLIIELCRMWPLFFGDSIIPRVYFWRRNSGPINGSTLRQRYVPNMFDYQRDVCNLFQCQEQSSMHFKCRASVYSAPQKPTFIDSKPQPTAQYFRLRKPNPPRKWINCSDTPPSTELADIRMLRKA